MAISKDDEPPGDPNGSFGQVLQWLRQQHGLPSRARIAAFVAEETQQTFSPSRLSQLMKDRADRPPSLPQLEACAKYFRVSPLVFFGDEHTRKLVNERAFYAAFAEFTQLVNAAQDPAAQAEVALHMRTYQAGGVHPDDLPNLTGAIRALIETYTQHRDATAVDAVTETSSPGDAAGPLFLAPRHDTSRA